MKWRLSTLRLEDMDIGHRIMLTVAIVVIVLILLACVGYVSGRWEAQSAPSKQIALCSDEPGINDEINKLAFQALDDALRKQIETLFTTWMKDESGQPERAATGVRRSAVAYVHAREAILNWNIPSCK